MLPVRVQDGGYVEPFTTSHLLVNSGERIGAILKPRPDTVETGDYWIQVQSRYASHAAPIALAASCK